MAKQQTGSQRSDEREGEGTRGSRGGAEGGGAQPRAQGAQVSQGTQGSQRTQGGQGTQGTQGQGTQGATAAGTRGDQERRRPVERETGGGAEGGAGMQRRSDTAMGARSAFGASGEGESSLLPAFMANPGLMAGAFMSNPFAFAQAMSQEMDRLFSSMGAGDAGMALGRGGSMGGRMTPGAPSRQAVQQGGRQGGRLGQWVPQLEVRQRGNELVVSADLPGLSPDDVNIDVEDGVLTISGERRQSSEDRQENYYRSERSYGSFVRSIPLPEGVDEEEVRAQFDNGVLEVTIPIPAQRARGRRIEIQKGSGRGESKSRVGEGAGRGETGRDQKGGMEIRPGEVGG